MLTKKRNRFNLPVFVVNPDRLVGAPEENKDQIKTAQELINRYFEADHTFYVRPLQILVTGKNPRSVKVTVEEILEDNGAYRADQMKVDEELGNLVEDCGIIVLDLLCEEFRVDSPYMLGKEGVVIWMMQPGEVADSIEADYRIDVKELSTSEARHKLRQTTHLPFSVVDQLLKSKKDPWQIEEMLQLVFPKRLNQEDLELIGHIFAVPLSEMDWIENEEDYLIQGSGELGKVTKQTSVD